MAKVNKKQAGLKRNAAQKNITLKGMVFTKHTKHEYDVDIKDILTTLGKLCQSIPQTDNKQPTTELLAELERGVGIYRTKYRISDKDYNNLPHLVVPSREYCFEDFISWKLAIIDIPEIDLFLDHHFDTFEGNNYAEKNNFVGVLQYIIYPQVMLHSFVDTATRLDRIMKWVRENKDIRQPTPLMWVGGDKELKPFSRRLYKWGCTKKANDFYNAIELGIGTEWKMEYKFLAYLIFKLVEKELIVASRPPRHFKGAEILFVDASLKKNKKLRLSEHCSRVKNNKKTHQDVYDFIDKIRYGYF